LKPREAEERRGAALMAFHRVRAVAPLKPLS
jgi:hypothetical protein